MHIQTYTCTVHGIQQTTSWLSLIRLARPLRVLVFAPNRMYVYLGHEAHYLQHSRDGRVCMQTTPHRSHAPMRRRVPAFYQARRKATV